MKSIRSLAVVLLTFFATAAALDAHAQYGGRQRGGGMGGPGGDGGARQQPPKSDANNPRSAVQPISDPIAAIERELPSLRIDLKLTPEQAPAFDSFERQVRAAAEASRLRTRHLSSFRYDDGSTLSAASIFNTVYDDDAARADAMKDAVEKLDALYAKFTPEQRRQCDRRIMQSLREPLGAS